VSKEGVVGQRRQATVVDVEPSGVVWLKSSASGGESSNCVEVALLHESVLVRRSPGPKAERLTVPLPAWTTFLADLAG
jgi:hypothetical protein